MSLHIRVIGTPVPQGSKRGFVNRHTQRVVLVEDNKKTRPWRQDVKAAALDARQTTGQQTYTGPVSIAVAFHFARPKHHYRTGRNAALLRDGAPSHVATKPDIDKLLRAILDALGEAGVWRDDALVAEVTSSKGYVDPPEHPGADIYITALTPSTVEAATPAEQPTLL